MEQHTGDTDDILNNVRKVIAELDAIYPPEELAPLHLTLAEYDALRLRLQRSETPLFFGTIGVILGVQIIVTDEAALTSKLLVDRLRDAGLRALS